MAAPVLIPALQSFESIAAPAVDSRARQDDRRRQESMVRLRKDVQGLVARRSFRFAPLTRSGRQLQAASGGSNIIITNFNS
jgi:hypothetical protein